MLFGLFETPLEKRLRLLEHDIEEDKKKREARAKGIIRFGTRYEDDYRYNK